MNIYEKIAKVMEEAKYVQKKGYNSFHKYAYATESDYLTVVRPFLLKYGLVVNSNVLNTSRDGEVTTATVEFTITNAEKPIEQIKSVLVGQGADKLDKGVYKALTGCRKYFFASNFLLETGDDAEKDVETEDSKPTAKVASPSKPALAAVPTAPSPEPTAAATTVSTTTKPVRSFRKVGQAPLANGSATATKNTTETNLEF